MGLYYFHADGGGGVAVFKATDEQARREAVRVSLELSRAAERMVRIVVKNTAGEIVCAVPLLV